jgi:hypothetical protein
MFGPMPLVMPDEVGVANGLELFRRYRHVAANDGLGIPNNITRNIVFQQLLGTWKINIQSKGRPNKNYVNTGEGTNNHFNASIDFGITMYVPKKTFVNYTQPLHLILNAKFTLNMDVVRKILFPFCECYFILFYDLKRPFDWDFYPDNIPPAACKVRWGKFGRFWQTVSLEDKSKTSTLFRFRMPVPSPIRTFVKAPAVQKNKIYEISFKLTKFKILQCHCENAFLLF